MIAAMMLLVGFTQCKKDNETPTSDEGVRITLTADYGQSGEKTDFNPAAGSFVWSDGTDGTEYINVGGAKSGYLGQLTGTGDGSSTKITFTGSISPADDEGTLYFFYLGNGNHAAANTVDFSKQYGDYEHVTNQHVAIGSASYTKGDTDFSATLNMAMTIAKFNLSGFVSASETAETVYLSGNDVYTTATINYNNGTITGNEKGLINIGTASNEQYVALIPASDNVETTLQFNSNSKTGSIAFKRGIQAGRYYTAAELGSLAVSASPGAGIPGAFSVSADKQVFFSKGNLQYQASTGTWRFAEHQYDAIGNNAGNNNFSDTRSTQSDWIDLFGWGTSGWAGASAYSTSHYQPWAYIGNNPSNTFGYGYGPNTKEGNIYNYTYSLTGTYANCDWGVYNTISNGGTGWRTLTGGSNDAEWNYLLFSRNASTVAETENARYFMAKIDDIWGLVILPDLYSHPANVKNPSNINTSASTYTITAYTTTEWNEIESAGAVFLPGVGYRSYSSNNPSYTENQGYYWTTTYNTNEKAYAMNISGNCSVNAVEKRRGCFVRLVKNVE